MAHELQLTREEAIVLFELVARFTKTDVLTIEDQAHRLRSERARDYSSKSDLSHVLMCGIRGTTIA